MVLSIHIDRVLFLPTTNRLTNISSNADVSTAGLQSSSGKNSHKTYMSKRNVEIQLLDLTGGVALVLVTGHSDKTSQTRAPMGGVWSPRREEE